MFTGSFIFMSKSASSNEHHAQLRYGKERLMVLGVSSVEEGISAAKRLVNEEGCRVIDLCGGFNEEDARAIRAATQGKALVCYSSCLPEDSKLMGEIIEELNELNK